MTTILVGNEDICKNMNVSDYVFRSHEYPGSHVIVKGDPTEADLNYAAQLAATHSRAKEFHVSVCMRRGVDAPLTQNLRYFLVSKM